MNITPETHELLSGRSWKWGATSCLPLIISCNDGIEYQWSLKTSADNKSEFFVTDQFGFAVDKLVPKTTENKGNNMFKPVKVIDDKMYPDEIMKAVREGARWAARSKTDGNWIEDDGDYTVVAKAIVEGYEIALVDTSVPEINWTNFDWHFFNQYHGIPVYDTNGEEELNITAILRSWIPQLRKSPWYPWFGGECPVPENVEVDLRLIGQAGLDHKTAYAGDVVNGEWEWEQFHFHIVDFRITGKVR